ncbi:hypothetical protein C8J56DRAFT_1065254 [Mycena floridula]|nr:hypothetical protein C8J56DRAFT_1065254 [Mycena floridula]
MELVFLIIEKLLDLHPKRSKTSPGSHVAVSRHQTNVGLPLLIQLQSSQTIRAEKALYRTIVLREGDDRFLDMIQSGRRPASFYQSRVEALCILEPLNLDDLYELFSACWGAHSIGIFDWKNKMAVKGDRHEDDLLDALASTNRRFSLPLFQNVTHLELYSFRNFDGFDGKQLRLLTNLTHLCFFLVASVGMNEVCIIQTRTYTQPTTTLDDIIDRHIEEPRVIFVTFNRKETQDGPQNFLWRDVYDEDSFVKQWGRQQEGEMDMWEEAERIVAIQRASLQAARST